jgi:hypothetical protein
MISGSNAGVQSAAGPHIGRTHPEASLPFSQTRFPRDESGKEFLSYLWPLTLDFSRR